MTPVFLQSNFAQSFNSPIIRIVVVAIALGLLYILGREVRKIPAKLMTLMGTAFIDMIGVLMIFPLLPFYVQQFGGNGINFAGHHFDVGIITGFIISSFTVAQLVSAPMWGRFSDRVGRRPTLIFALTASGIAYLIFGFANSLFLLFLSRVVQGAGGGTVGVIQAYVADSTAPKDRTRALGWLSATTNLGVALGPVLGSFALALGKRDLMPGPATLQMGNAGPGIIAALLCFINILFAARYLTESRDASEHAPVAGEVKRTSRQVIWRVMSHSKETSSRLIWIYAIAIGAFYGTAPLLPLILADRLGATDENIGYFIMYLGGMGVIVRTGILSRMIERLGEPRLARLGLVLLAAGLAMVAMITSYPTMLISLTLMPMGTAFVFPCVTAMLSRVVPNKQRGLYMGVQHTFGGVSRVAFPLIAGYGMDVLGQGIPFVFAGVMVIGTLLLTTSMESYIAAPVAADN